MTITILKQHHFRDLLLKLELMGYIRLLSQLINPKFLQKLQYLNHSHRNLILSLAMIHTKTIQQPWVFFMWSSTLERFRILGLLLTNYSLHPKVKLNYSPLTLRTGTSLSREFSPNFLSCIHLFTFNGRHWSITHSLSIWFSKTVHIHTLCIPSRPLCDYGILTVAMKHCLTYGIPLFNSTLPTLRVPFPSILFSRWLNLDLQGMQLPCMVLHISLAN